MERKYIAIIILAAIIIAGVGGYYAYGSYTDSKYDESFKMQVYYVTKINDSLNSAEKIGNLSNPDEKSFNETRNQYVSYYDDAIKYSEKVIQYRQNMVNYASNDIEKNYATYFLKIGQINLKLLKIKKQAVELRGYNQQPSKKIEDLWAQIEDLDKQANTLAEKKDEVKLSSSEFNQRIENLTKEAKTVTT